MKIHKPIRQIKSEALSCLAGRYTVAVVVTLCFYLFSFVEAYVPQYLNDNMALKYIVMIVFIMIEIFLGIGLRVCMLRYSRRDYPTVGVMFDAFPYYLKSLVYFIPQALIAWMMGKGLEWFQSYAMSHLDTPVIVFGLVLLLLCISFLIAMVLACFMPFLYLLIDKRERNIFKLLALSWRMMRGNRLKLIGMQLSFLGWMFLFVFTCGIGYLFLYPYMMISECVFYNEILFLEDPLTEEKNIGPSIDVGIDSE